MEHKNPNSGVNDYLDLYEEVHARVGDEKVALGIMHELAKDARMRLIAAERRTARESANNGEVKATEKQLAFLESLNVKTIPRNLSKAVASRLIDEAQAQMIAA